MALQLYLNGEAADLPANARVRLNQASNAAEQLDVRIGERSYGFTLPPTRANDRLFAHARQQLQLRKFNRTIDLTARLVADGVDVLPSGAVCRLNAAGWNGYEVVLYAPGVALGELLAAKNLRELTTLPPRDYYDLTDLQDLIYADRTTETLAAPFVSYGNFFSAATAAGGLFTPFPLWAQDFGLLLDDYVLSVYAANVLEAIFREAGYRIEGAPLLDDKWNRAAIPYTGAEPFPWPWRNMSNGTLLLTNTTQTYSNDPCELLSAPLVMYDNPSGSTGPLGFADQLVMGQFLAQVEGEYRVFGYINTTLSGGLLAEGGMWLEVKDATGGIVITEVLPRFSYPAPSASTTYDATVTVPGRGSSIRLIAGPFGDFGGVNLQWQELNMQISFSGGITTIQPAALLPSMTQKDFVKAFLTLTNSTFELDEDRKVVRFSYRDVMTPQLLAGALDLSDYLNSDSFQYRPAAQFKAVEFTYAVDSKDVVASTPARLGGGQGAGWADTTVALAAVGRTDTKAITVPFAATAVREYNRPDSTDHRFIPTVSDETHLNQPLDEVDWSFDYVPRLLLVGEVTDSADLLDFNTRTSVQIPYRRATSYPTWSELVDQRYATTLELLDASELVTTEILLSPTLYRELRPGRLVRVNGVVYTVNKLDGYEPGSTRPATLELLRYVPPSGRF